MWGQGRGGDWTLKHGGAERSFLALLGSSRPPGRFRLTCHRGRGVSMSYITRFLARGRASAAVVSRYPWYFDIYTDWATPAFTHTLRAILLATHGIPPTTTRPIPHRAMAFDGARLPWHIWPWARLELLFSTSRYRGYRGRTGSNWRNHRRQCPPGARHSAAPSCGRTSAGKTRRRRAPPCGHSLTGCTKWPLHRARLGCRPRRAWRTGSCRTTAFATASKSVYVHTRSKTAPKPRGRPVIVGLWCCDCRLNLAMHVHARECDHTGGTGRAW